MSAQHTPGPWTLHPLGIPYVNCGTNGPSFGPVVMAGTIDEMMANAHLIAAAPKLAEVLSEVRELIDGYVDVLDDAEGVQIPNKAMRAQAMIDDALKAAGL